jgi:hypothetical protein
MTTVRTISPVDGSTSAATDRDRSALVAWAPSIVGGAVTAANRPVVFATERAFAMFCGSPGAPSQTSSQPSIAPMSPSNPVPASLPIAESGRRDDG